MISMNIDAIDSDRHLFELVLLTLTAGALAAVDVGQHHRLAVSARTLQTEEAHRGVGVQPVTATLTHGLQVRLLSRPNKHKNSSRNDSAAGRGVKHPAHIL